MNDLELRNVVKRFGQVVAVDNVSLQVAKGELISFLGPSGCGKTTALRLIAGHESIDGGDIVIRGRSARGVPPYRRNVGMVFQNYALFPHLTVAENVGFGLRERRMPRAVIREKTHEAIDLVHLRSLGGRYPSELSGGQQQRVALARALVIEPELLLLDEPLSNLDAKLREEMRVEIKELQAKLGLTTIFVTHDQVEALTLSTRVVIMRAGRVTQSGTPEKVYAKPTSRFTFDFLGGTNVFRGRVLQARNGEVVFQTEGGLQLIARGTPRASQQVAFIGVRPEAIAIETSPENGKPNVFPGRVRNTLYRGWTRELLIQLSSGDSVKVVQVLSGGADLAQDANVTISFPPEACHLLEGDEAK